jgi:O-acetylhomoserine (thiol)-lyase
MERHAENALRVAEFLAAHPLVQQVNHPALPEHPQHARYKRYFPQGGGAIFTVELSGGQEEAFRFINALKLFSLVANVADMKSLVIHPASTTHSQLTEAEQAACGIYPNTVRLSIGTEHIADILDDLKQALSHL